MAERKCQRLEPDRDSQLDDMVQQMTELGDQMGVRQLTAMMAEWQETEWAQQHGNPARALVQVCAEQIKAAMVDLGADRERMSTVRVVSTLQEDVSAQLQPFSDGSGLAMISDSIFTLCNVYSQYVGSAIYRVTSASRLVGMWRAIRVVKKRSLGDDPTLLTGQLRYHNVNQRFFGLAAKLGLRQESGAEQLGYFVVFQSMLFVIGHEIAHHALGHTSAPSGFSPGEHLPVCSDDQSRELDADLFAYRALVRVQQRELADVPMPYSGFQTPFSALGALVAMLAVHSSEQALFVRRGCTHPAAPHRASLLLGELDDKGQAFARIFLANLLTATDDSSTFTPGRPPFNWAKLAAAPEIHTPHSPNYLQQIAMLDALQCKPVDALVQMIKQVDERYASSLSKGARLAAEGDVRDALLHWGLLHEKADSLCDPAQALTFHSLVSSLRSAFAARELTADALLAASITAATLAARSMMTAAPGG